MFRANCAICHGPEGNGKTLEDGRVVPSLRTGEFRFKTEDELYSLALAEGLSLAECDALADWRPSTLFSERERAVLAYADTMTRDIAVPDAVFAELKRHFNTREIVELTVLIGTYNMNARVLQALELDLEPLAS